jgi:hypothetical protein
MRQYREYRGVERGTWSVELIQDEDSAGDAIPWAYGEVKACEVREKMAYLLTCPTVARHLSFVPLPLLPNL